MALPQRDNNRPLPAGWERVIVGPATTVYISNKLKLATLEYASTKKKIKRQSKVSPESGTFVLHPRPPSLPDDWEQAVAVNPDRTTGSWIYHNVATMQTTSTDPRTQVDKDNPLPAGWEIGYDEDGDIFFIDHNSGTKTYDDPRLVVTEAISGVRIVETEPEKKVSRKGSWIHEVDGYKGDMWRIAPVSYEDFNALPQNLTTKDKLPSEVVTKAFNRYTNILPNPRTRVRLTDYQPATPTSEYINANYISSFDKQPREYIAAMGPLDNTIEAFWRMVWQHKSPAIVMTTPLMELGRVKCARYWPTVRYNEAKKLGDKVWGDIRVAVLKGERQPGYIRTQLRLTRGKETHFVSHFWFTEWPDHGVPESASHVIGMMSTVREHCTKHSGPAVVHCSAGIGRTGTFIAIDHATQLLEKNHTVDVLEIVHNLRLCRGGMVQHPQQYSFVHRACLEYARQRGTSYAVIPLDKTVDEYAAELAALADVPAHPIIPKNVDWKASMRSKKLDVLSELVSSGRPANMPEEEYEKAKRRLEKLQSTTRAQKSKRRNLDDAEMHGELRLGTLSGGSPDGQYRPSAQTIFEQP